MKKKLNKRITIRMDEELYRKIECMARNGGMTPVEYARRMLDKGKVKITMEAIVEAPEIHKIQAELGKIGSNLNQIARYFNGGGVRSREIYDGINRALVELYEMKYTVERMGGTKYGNSKTHTG